MYDWGEPWGSSLVASTAERTQRPDICLSVCLFTSVCLCVCVCLSHGQFKLFSMTITAFSNNHLYYYMYEQGNEAMAFPTPYQRQYLLVRLTLREVWQQVEANDRLKLVCRFELKKERIRPLGNSMSKVITAHYNFSSLWLGSPHTILPVFS